MGPNADQRHRTTYYQYRADRARRSLHGIDTQVAKAEKAIAGQAAIKRNRFITLTGGTRTVNRDLEAKVQGPGRLEAVRHQPRRHPRVRDRRLPPAVARRALLPDVQTRPAGPTDLSPQTRIDRRPPRRRVRRPRRLPLDRTPAPAGPSRGSSGPSAATAKSPSTPATTNIPAEQPLPDDERAILAQLRRDSAH